MRHAGYCLLAAWMTLCLAVAGWPGTAGDAEGIDRADAADEGSSGPGAFLPLTCTPDQTGGFHDYPEDEESYVPALFTATRFRLDENVVFMTNLPETPDVDLFVTFTAGDDPVTSELECRQVRGVDGSLGYSCVNIPPSVLLLINQKTLRFTRTSVGGWTFAGANESQSGDSIFVEYGTCAAAPDP
jgi:hypothetical protein